VHVDEEGRALGYQAAIVSIQHNLLLRLLTSRRRQHLHASYALASSAPFVQKQSNSVPI